MSEPEPVVIALPPTEPEPTPPDAKHVPWGTNRVSVEQIKKAVATDFGVTKMDIHSQKRSPTYTLPRHLIFYLAVKMTPISFAEIGRRVGDKDHSTVINGCNRIKNKIAADPEFAARVEAIRHTLIGA